MPAWMIAMVAGSALIVALVVVMTMTKKLSLLIGVGGLLFFSSMALPVEWDDQGVRNTFWLGLQQNRDYFYGLFGILTFGLLVFQLPRLVGKRKSMMSITLVAIGLFMAALRFIHEGVTDGVLSIGLAAIVLPALLLVPTALIDDEDDMHPLLRTILVVNYAWFAMCTVQFLVDRSLLAFGNSNRFVGLLSNPQHAGAFVACLITTTLYMALNEPKKMWRVAALGMLSANALLLMWTGSRTGLGMAVVGSAGVLITRMGRAVLMLPLAAGFFALVLKVFGAGFSEATTVFDRLGGSEDTRSAAWARMFNRALEDPLIGAGTSNAGSSENSWLYGFASYGIGMLVLSLLLTLFGVIQIYSTLRGRWGLPRGQQTAMDVSAGIVLAYFAGSVFEGFFSARISPNLVIVMLFSGVLARLLQLSAERRNNPDAIDPDGYSEYDDYDEDQAEGEWDEESPQPVALW